jgi:hypothetical protein
MLSVGAFVFNDSRSQKRYRSIMSTENENESKRRRILTDDTSFKYINVQQSSEMKDY